MRPRLAAGTETDILTVIELITVKLFEACSLWQPQVSHFTASGASRLLTHMPMPMCGLGLEIPQTVGVGTAGALKV